MYGISTFKGFKVCKHFRPMEHLGSDFCFLGGWAGFYFYVSQIVIEHLRF